MSVLTKILQFSGYILFRPLWWLERLVPRSKNVWVFGAWYGQKYSDNSKWLYEYVLEQNPKIKAVWITKNREVYEKLRSDGKPVCMSSSPAGAWFCMRALYALLTSGVVDVNRFFLNGCRQIWLWHGMPLKKILQSDDAYIAKTGLHKALSTFLNPYLRFHPYATLSSADFFNDFLMEAFDLPKEKIWNTGLPRCDAFYSEKKESFISALRLKFSNSKIFLYMPTFRMSSEMEGKAFSPFDFAYGYDEISFKEFLEKNNIVFLYKPHFVDSAVQVQIDSDHFIILNDSISDDLYVLLSSVDALLTDYSSVFFDFIPSKKPIYLLPFDYEQYIHNSRSHYFDMYKEMTGVVCSSWREFYAAVENEKWKSIDFEKNKKLAEFLDGKSCEKVIERLVESCN